MVPFFWKDVLRNAEPRGGLFGLPNAMRYDKGPWYLDAAEDKVLYFTDKYTKQQPLCGAAVVATSSQTIQVGNELFLNYALKSPVPRWASDWYEDNTSPNKE